MSDDFAVDLDALGAMFRDLVPHNRALGLTVVHVAFEPATVTARLAYDERFVGNPETGVLHGGVITTLIDTTCGASVFFKLKKPIPIATLDLRIDYLRPAEPGRDVFVRAECFKTTRNVAFVRALAHHDDETDPIASAAATFMIGTGGGAVADLPLRRREAVR